MLKLFRDGARVAAPVLIIFQLVLVAKGYIKPLPEAKEILAERENTLSILTGFYYGKGRDSETYLLVNKDNLGSYSLVITKNRRDIDVSENQEGILSYLLGYFFLVCAWMWSLFWPIESKNTPKMML
jgi:hypothetical protein